jgi:hypothetical protein
MVRIGITIDRRDTSLTHIYARRTIKIDKNWLYYTYMKIDKNWLYIYESTMMSLTQESPALKQRSYIMDEVRSHDKCEYYCTCKLNHNYSL